jgi:hypothetical protein
VLVEVERAVIEDAVHDGGRGAVHPQNEHPQPAAIEKTPGRLVVKRAQRRGAERSSVRVEPVLVVVREPFERVATIAVAGHSLELDIELLLQRAQTAANIGAV